MVLALMGLMVGGCDWKKKEMTKACKCMVRCLDEDFETPEEDTECRKRCKGKYYEGYAQGAEMARQIIEGYRDDCSL